jgi:two-component system OmpR family sensor kinase
MAVLAVVLIGAAAVITRTTERHLVAQVDEQLALARVPRRDGPLGRQADAGPSSLYVGWFDGDSIETLYEPSLIGEDPPLPVIEGRTIELGVPFTVASEDGDVRYRAVARREPRATLVYALPLSDVDATVRRLIAVEAIATAAALAVLGVLTWWVVRLGVRPVKRMTAVASAIAGGDLSARVPDVGPGTEAGDLGTALNQMLDQRQRVEDRLRQFVGDASHELRTPVTTIRGYAELYRAGALSDPHELAEAMRRTEQEAIRMGSLVDDLLHLARLDQGRPLARERVDLAAVIGDAARDASAVEPGRPVHWDASGDVVITGDEQRLRQVVANLVANALVHTEPGTPIHLRAADEGSTAVVEVADEGPGMPEDVATKAFERFYRADPSRVRSAGGSGLGLAIVAATVHAHGGTTKLLTAPGEGTTVRVELPR